MARVKLELDQWQTSHEKNEDQSRCVLLFCAEPGCKISRQHSHYRSRQVLHDAEHNVVQKVSCLSNMTQQRHWQHHDIQLQHLSGKP